MVANALSIADRFVEAPESVLSGRSHLIKFTRRDLPALVSLGIVPEDATTELLDGMIVLVDRAARGEDILRVGKAHRITIERLSDLRAAISNTQRHVECQQPLACADAHEPQPDFMVVRGTLNQLDEDYPSVADVFCVLEVSDSSYERDSGDKLKNYAKAGVPQYIIINLRNRAAEIYVDPDRVAGTYSPPTMITEQQQLSLRVGDGEFFSVDLASLLP